jgi:hypothetical protein
MPNGEEPAAKKNKKRTGYFKMRDEVELGKKVGLEVRAYDKDGDFVGRLKINCAGLEAFVGQKGKTSLGNLSWETVFERLAKKN